MGVHVDLRRILSGTRGRDDRPLRAVAQHDLDRRRGLRGAEPVALHQIALIGGKQDGLVQAALARRSSAFEPTDDVTS
jgi:hypothetical protein